MSDLIRVWGVFLCYDTFVCVGGWVGVCVCVCVCGWAGGPATQYLLQQINSL